MYYNVALLIGRKVEDVAFVHSQIPCCLKVDTTDIDKGRSGIKEKIKNY
jgi:hypothetical protein